MTRLVGSLFTSLAASLLAGCGGETGPGPEIHDTKYQAVDAAGILLDAAVAPGQCVFDRFTGLTWEVKSAEPGLRFRDHTYSWYDPAESHDGELDYRGLANGGVCSDTACDTSSYVAAVKATRLCGYDDWRLPSRDELGSISDPRKGTTPPTINTRHFPFTQAGAYWSGNDYQFQWNAAWLWNFTNGLDHVDWKAAPHYVRLVRGEPRGVERVKD